MSFLRHFAGAKPGFAPKRKTSTDQVTASKRKKYDLEDQERIYRSIWTRDFFWLDFDGKTNNM